MSGITNVHRVNTNNVGDQASTPIHYYDFGPVRELDIKFAVRDDETLTPTVIIGGGGMLNFEPSMDTLMQRKPAGAKYIGWGLSGGSKQLWCVKDQIRLHNDEVLPPYPWYMDKFDLLGIRDWNTGYRWVPCVSCMSKAFDTAPAPKHEVVVYKHRAVDIPGLPKLPTSHSRTEDHPTLKSAINFIASGAVVLTNSYHGAYWGMLLKRKVILVNGFWMTMKGYRFRPAYATHKDWRKRVKTAPIHNEALEISREANRLFHADVMNYLGQAP